MRGAEEVGCAELVHRGVVERMSLEYACIVGKHRICRTQDAMPYRDGEHGIALA